MIKVLINGCNGKMGQEVINAINNNEKFEVLNGVDIKENPSYIFPVYTNTNEIKERPDVIIDFSVPVATMKILEYAKVNNIPIVIATTGFSNEEKKKVEEYSKSIPIFQSANMSYDINLMKKVVAEVAKNLNKTDIEIIETHHNRKIDSPSGTALLLADSINNALDSKMEYNFNRFQNREKRKKNEIGFSSIRGGNIVGEHTVIFFGENESFEITHKAYSRGVFAEGALKGAEFIVEKINGYYSMDDII